MSTIPTTILTPSLFTPVTHTLLFPSIVSVHVAYITIDATIATFLPPLSPETILEWWTQRVEEVKRGEVEKLLVSPSRRRQGVARMMEKLEMVVWKWERTLLCLSTETDSPAESVYPRLGYKEVGKIPHHSMSPGDGTLESETFFYKDLKDTQYGDSVSYNHLRTTTETCVTCAV